MDDTSTTKEKRKINRSAAYPGLPLAKAIEATKMLRENLGSGPYSRESAATALNYSAVSGASTTKMGACVHFGLLVRKNNAYSQSELADKILRSVDDNERLEAIKVAAQKPVLYSNLIKEFEGKALPKMLDNILVRNHGITERVAKDAANCLIKSLEFAGILKNGIVVLNAQPDTADATVDDANDTLSNPADDPESLESSSGTQKTGAQPGYITVEIPETDVRVMFPLDHAYELSIGKFATGIEALARNIKDIHPQETNEPAPTA